MDAHALAWLSFWGLGSDDDIASRGWARTVFLLTAGFRKRLRIEHSEIIVESHVTTGSITILRPRLASCSSSNFYVFDAFGGLGNYLTN